MGRAADKVVHSATLGGVSSPRADRGPPPGVALSVTASCTWDPAAPEH